MDLGVSRVSGVCIPSSALTLFHPDFIASGVLVLFSQLDFKLLSVASCTSHCGGFRELHWTLICVQSRVQS